jgi:hypothetical protein
MQNNRHDHEVTSYFESEPAIAFSSTEDQVEYADSVERNPLVKVLFLDFVKGLFLSKENLAEDAALNTREAIKSAALKMPSFIHHSELLPLKRLMKNPHFEKLLEFSYSFGETPACSLKQNAGSEAGLLFTRFKNIEDQPKTSIQNIIELDEEAFNLAKVLFKNTGIQTFIDRKWALIEETELRQLALLDPHSKSKTAPEDLALLQKSKVLPSTAAEHIKKECERRKGIETQEVLGIAISTFSKQDMTEIICLLKETYKTPFSDSRKHTYQNLYARFVEFRDQAGRLQWDMPLGKSLKHKLDKATDKCPFILNELRDQAAEFKTNNPRSLSLPVDRHQVDAARSQFYAQK